MTTIFQHRDRRADSRSGTRRLIPMSGMLIITCAGMLAAQSGGPFELSWSTMDAAGVVQSTGGPYSLSGTLGQADSSIMAVPSLTLIGGFWSISNRFPFAPPDLDQDYDVDYDDIEYFVACATGDLLGPPIIDCASADLDGDGDVDASDFGVLQQCLSGSSILPAPDCGQ